MPARPWPPAATLDTLRARAALLHRIHVFFERREVMEVNTPVLSAAGTVDPNIHSFAVNGDTGDPSLWLHTSPEFAMKRLLAAGSGAIYQICPVFRREERGRLHNPEFHMLEWYRPGFDHHALMDELAALLRNICTHRLLIVPARRLTYRDAFTTHAGVDPFRAEISELGDCLSHHSVYHSLDRNGDRDVWLDLIMASVVGPRLGRDAPALVYDYPASQAALARVRPGDPPVAERFELFVGGIEVANGFHELTDADEQARRFEREHGRGSGRRPPIDRALIEALHAGLPPCAGVAVGLDRLLMLDLDLSSIAEAIAFPADRA